MTIKALETGVARHRSVIDAVHFKVLHEHWFECEPFDCQISIPSLTAKGET
ncbi:hypothetical protein AB8A28_00845 [Tardiphaga sp. 71_E8_N1_1]|uniref:hypothetical protein n=1 Tax=Tardiphaga sp. 71_E8_N1_1 TaxID=3240784 RepID=UPI003F8C2EDB